MKFLFITATPLNPIEGSGTYVGIETLKTTLEKLGHSVQILAPDFWCPNFVLKRYLFNRFQLSGSHALRGNLREKPEEIVVIGFDCDGYHLKTSVPYIVSIKGVLADEAKQEKGWIRRLLQLQSSWEKKNVHRADRIIVTSQYCQKMVQQYYQVPFGKIRVIPELIDIQTWEKLLEEAPRWINRTEVSVLTVCRMYPRKNLGALLRAWKLVRQKEPTAQLRIVGTGQEYQRWVRLAKDLRVEDSVSFLGDRTRQELAEEYKNCTLFCLPSRQEGFGIVFLEAMAAGKPIVAGRAAAIPEVVREGKEGLLVSPDNPQALADALIKLIRNPALCEAFGDSGRLRAQQYDTVPVAEEWLSFLSTLPSRIAMRAEKL